MPQKKELDSMSVTMARKKEVSKTMRSLKDGHTHFDSAYCEG